MFTNNFIRKCLILIPIVFLSAITHAEILFEENFDDQPDWTSSMYSPQTTEQHPDSGITFPVGWDAVYQANLFKRPTMEILASNTDKTRSGTGKSFVSWKEHGKNRARQFASNGTIHKIITGPGGNGHDQLYVEFWIRFGPDWTAERNISKLFRIYAWQTSGSIFNAFSGGDIGPLMLWDYENDVTFGNKNRFALRGGPYGENYKPDWAPGVPEGDLSYISQHLQQIPDKENGGLIPTTGTATHNMVWGPPSTGQWTKVGFFVKMNSANDVADGVLMHWRDDLLVLKSEEVQWMRPNTQGLTPNEVKWNVVAIGGNDYIGGEYPHPIYPNSAEHEEWYAIDDLLVSTEIPETLLDGGASPPTPPTSVEIN